VPPRVVLVEDDDAMQMYVDAALGHLSVELVCCRTVSEGWRALSDAPPTLLVTDLMLRGESGITLVEKLRKGPPGLRSTRVVVTSAAADAPGVRERLEPLGVWRLLCKPVGLDVFEGCVRDAIQVPSTEPGLHSAGTSSAEVDPHCPIEARHADAIAELFGGDRSLYLDFQAACREQFLADVTHGDAAFERHDSPAVRRLAHNLGSVLRTLGEPAAAAQADRIEAAAIAANLPDGFAVWQKLRALLVGGLSRA